MTWSPEELANNTMHTKDERGVCLLYWIGAHSCAVAIFQNDKLEHIISNTEHIISTTNHSDMG